MRILYLHQYFCPPGGSGNNRSYELAKSWVEQGHSVTMVTSTAYFPDNHSISFRNGVGHLEVDGISVLVIDSPYSHMMPFKRRVRAFLQFYRRAKRVARRFSFPSKLPFDLIYASSTPLTVGELGRKLSRKLEIPFVFETVDVWPDVPIGMGILKNRLLINWLNRRTDRLYSESAAVVALSEGMRDQVLSHGVPKDKVHVIHNGTHPESIPFVERGGNRMRRAGLVAGAGEGKSLRAESGNEGEEIITAIYTGTVGIANGLDELLKAAKLIQEGGVVAHNEEETAGAEVERRHACPEIRFVVLGGGNDLERVKGLAKEWGIRNVEFKARVPKEEVPRIMENADIGVVCFAPYSVLEANSANKFYDYLASGLPVITNYRGWQAGYLEEYECGIATDQGDAKGYAENIVKLALDAELREKMGRNGRKLAENKFDRRVLAGRLLELFEKILKKEPSPENL